MLDGWFTFRPIRCESNKTKKRSAEYHKKHVLVKMGPNPPAGQPQQCDMYWTCRLWNGLLFCHSLTIPVRFYVRIFIRMSTVLQQNVCPAVLCLSFTIICLAITYELYFALPKWVCTTPIVKRIAFWKNTTSTSRRVVTLCLWFHCFRVVVEFELLSPPKLGGDVDTMPPEPTRLPI